MKEYNITNYKHVICSQHILRHITAKLAKDEKVSSEKERRMKERRFIRNWRRTIGMLAMLVSRKYVRSTWIWSRKTIPPFTSISWIGETVNSSTLMTNLTSVKIRTILVNESLNGRMRLKTDLDDPIRDSNCYNIIYRFIILALTLLIDQTTGMPWSATWSQTPIRRSSTTQPYLVSIYLQSPSSSRSSCCREGI